MSRRLIGTLATAVILGGTPVLSGAQIIDTRPPGQEFFWSGFGSGVILGQSFSTPGSLNTTLANWTLYDVKVNSGQPVTYTASISEWNSVTRTTGATVWSTSGSDLSTSYTDLNFAVNADLTAGTQYLFAFFANASGGNFFTGLTPYAGGGFYYQNGATPSGSYSAQWSAYDLEFSAQFVPEPSTVLLFGSGLVGLIGFAVIRRETIV